MATSRLWIIIGARVGLSQDEILVGKGIILSLDPLRKWQNVPVGIDRLLVKLDEVSNQDMELDVREIFEDMAGSILVWEKSKLVNLTSEDRILDERVGDVDDNDEDGSPTRKETVEDMPLVENVIQKSSWMSMSVKIMEEENVTFAVAMIAAINPEAVFQGL